jgi:DNA-binding response OmpR family regulator
MSSDDTWRTKLRSLSRTAPGIPASEAGGGSEDPPLSAGRGRAPSGRVRTRASASILIIDDDPLVATELKRILRHHRVAISHAGEAALAKLRAHDFDIVVSDVMMPHPSGIDAYRALCREGSPIVARFIFVTGGGHDADAQRFLSEAHSPCLPKPVDPHALLSRIRCLLADETSISGRETA